MSKHNTRTRPLSLPAALQTWSERVVQPTGSFTARTRLLRTAESINPATEARGLPLGSQDRPDVIPADDSTHSINYGQSINGPEVVLPGAESYSSASNLPLRPHREREYHRNRNSVWLDLSNKQLPPENTELMIKLLEKRDEEKIQRLKRTYVAGQALADFDPSAVTLKVGIAFLSGADEPQVTRLEQNMNGRDVEQKGALWKVNTAGLLLSDYHVTSDLSIDQRDQTLEIAKKARSRLQRPGSMTATPESSTRAVMLRGEKYDAAVTIDSDEVHVVNDLRPLRNEWDVESTLIEVDGSSMMDLMVHYRHLIVRGGPDMTFQEKKALLETMIEDARRICVRSPILFRMQTRSKIINSKNTRYGVDHGRYFQTLTTSRGILETISLSASYFDSLKPVGTRDETQDFIRPKFLQMLVLLLSLLNNDDLSEISGYLETTYGLRADREHLELAFLKVIPLMAINPTVFLKSLRSVFEGHSLSEPLKYEDHSRNWDELIRKIVDYGCLLPGTVDQLGRKKLSWIPKWPSKWPNEGFDSSTIFNNLQYSGADSRAFNEIHPVELHPEARATELIVIMSNNETYTISCADLEPITCLTPGTYIIQEARQGGQNCDVHIVEFNLNGSIREAIIILNSIIHRYNQWVASKGNGIKDLALRLKKGNLNKPVLMGEFPSFGRITMNKAVLGNAVLASTCKYKGRKITAKDAMRLMIWVGNEIMSLVRCFERRLGEIDNRHVDHGKETIKQDLSRVAERIENVGKVHEQLAMEEDITDEPIAKVLYAGGVDPREIVWFDYKAWTQANMLFIEARRANVMECTWLSDELIKVSLDAHAHSVFVAPLHPVQEDYETELRVGDIVVLAGKYLIVATRHEDTCGYYMTNYLMITDVEERKQDRRGRNRAEETETSTTTVFY